MTVTFWNDLDGERAFSIVREHTERAVEFFALTQTTRRHRRRRGV